MGGHNIWSRRWQNDCVRNKLTSHSIDSVGQAVGVRSAKGADKSRLESTRQRAGQWCQQGIQQHEGTTDVTGARKVTAGKSVVWDECRRLLVSKETKGKLMTIESRQAEVRKPLMAVKSMQILRARPTDGT